MLREHARRPRRDRPASVVERVGTDTRGASVVLVDVVERYVLGGQSAGSDLDLELQEKAARVRFDEYPPTVAGASRPREQAGDVAVQSRLEMQFGLLQQDHRRIAKQVVAKHRRKYNN